MRCVRRPSCYSAYEMMWHSADKSSSNALLWTFVKHHRWSIFAGVLPRLAYTGFTFTQPFLVQRVLDFVGEPEQPSSSSIAYGLIGAYAIVYFGISVSRLIGAVQSHNT